MLVEPRRVHPKISGLTLHPGLPASQPGDHPNSDRITHRTVGGDDAVDLIDRLRTDRRRRHLQLGVLLSSVVQIRRIDPHMTRTSTLLTRPFLVPLAIERCWVR